MIKKYLITFFVLLIGFALTTNAAAPTMINYQGLLLNNVGDPVADDTYSVLFTIYDASAGGDSKWSETQNVTTESGMFSVALGSITPILDTVFNQPDRFLGIKVGTDPEITPRAQLLNVPWAFRVATIDGSTGGTVGGDLEVTGDTDVGGDLDVIGNTNIASNVVVGGAMSVASDINGGGNASVNFDMVVGGTLAVGSSASVSGNGTFTGSVTAGGDVNSNNLNTTSAVSVGTDATVTNNLDVGGSASISGNVSGGSNATFGGDLNVAGGGTFGNNSSINGSLSVTTSAVIYGSLGVGGYIAAGGDIDCNNMTTLGNAFISSNLAAAGSLTIGGAASLTSDVTIGNNADIGGDLTVFGQSAVSGNSSVGGNLNITGPTTAGGDVTVTGLVTASSGIVTGDVASGDGMRFGNKLSFISSITPIVTCYSGYIWWDYPNRALKLTETNAGNNYCHYIVGKNEGAGFNWNSNFINSGGTVTLATLNANGECATVEVSSEIINGGYIKLYCFFSNGKLTAHYSYRYQ